MTVSIPPRADRQLKGLSFLAVFARDGGHCRRCGTIGTPAVPATVRRILEVDGGEPTYLDNVVTLCDVCEAQKLPNIDLLEDNIEKRDGWACRVCGHEDGITEIHKLSEAIAVAATNLAVAHKECLTPDACVRVFAENVKKGLR